MAKEVAGQLKLQIKGGAANPSPPVGPALGSKGINIMGFCKEFNARTQDKAGKVLPVVITYYADKSFDFVIKTSPAAVQLKEIAKVKSGSASPNRNKVAEVTCQDHRRGQAEGPQLLYRRVCHEADCRYGTQHGHHRKGRLPSISNSKSP